MGREKSLLGKETEALAAFELASRLKPQADDYLYRVGTSLLRRQRNADAEDVYRRLLAINPATADRLLMKIEAGSP
ncbi:MAG: hypothetical protein ACREVI_09540 [Steroidobacteraceae bacterium]